MTFTEPSIPPTHASQPESAYDPSQRAGEDHFPRDREEASKPEQAPAPHDPGPDPTDPAVSNRKSRSRAADPDRVRGMAQKMMEFMDAAPELSLPDTLPDIECAADCLSQPIVLPSEVVHGVFHRGAKAVIGGGSKSYKTWVLSDLALSVATGRDWLGFPTTQGRVLYLNLELAREYYNRRLQQICEAKEICASESSDLSLWHLRGHAADFSLLGPKIIKRMEEQDYSLLIINPIYKAIGGRDENKAGDITGLLNELERVAVKTGAAVVFGAHFSKGNQASKERHRPDWRQRRLRPRSRLHPGADEARDRRGLYGRHDPAQPLTSRPVRRPLGFSLDATGPESQSSAAPKTRTSAKKVLSRTVARRARHPGIVAFRMVQVGESRNRDGRKQLQSRANLPCCDRAGPPFARG